MTFKEEKKIKIKAKKNKTLPLLGGKWIATQLNLWCLCSCKGAY